MEDFFKNYKEYKRFVDEEWEYGNINELEQDGLIVDSKREPNHITYRHLTEEEYNKKFKKMKKTNIKIITNGNSYEWKFSNTDLESSLDIIKEQIKSEKQYIKLIDEYWDKIFKVIDTPKEEKYLSLFEFLGRPAGSNLGLAIFKDAKNKKIKMKFKDIKTRNYSGKIVLYPESFLKNYFSPSVNLKTSYVDVKAPKFNY